MMADYDCNNVHAQSGSSDSENAVSSSQALQQQQPPPPPQQQQQQQHNQRQPSSCESMWDGPWTQASSADATTVSIADLQLQAQGVAKNPSNFHQDLLSSWLSGFQGLPQAPGVLHGQSAHAVDHPQVQPETGSVVYPDEFSRLNLCSTSSDSHASQLFLDTSCNSGQGNESRGGTNAEGCSKSEQSTVQVLRPAAPGHGRVNSQSLSSNQTSFDRVLDLNTDQVDQRMVHMSAEADLSSGSRTSSPPSFGSYGQMMQHLVGQFDQHPTSWPMATSPSVIGLPQPAADRGLRSISIQDEPANTSCSESVILHHHARPGAHDNFSGGGPTVAYGNTSADHMYAELHGLLTKNPPAPDQLPQAPVSPAAVPFGTPAWPQFNDVPMQSEHTLFTSSVLTTSAAAASAAAGGGGAGGGGREEVSPTSAGTARSSIFNPAGHGDSSERQEKRPSREQETENSASVKRSCIEHAIWQSNAALLERASDPKLHAALVGSKYGVGSTSNLDMHASVGPALNTNGKPRARRGSATDPQSVYARHRRERITERLKILQHLVPNGAKVDIVTMLEEAINYVKFLQLQVRLLSSDEYWIYAPMTYNGMDVSLGMHFQGMDSQA